MNSRITMTVLALTLATATLAAPPKQEGPFTGKVLKATESGTHDVWKVSVLEVQDPAKSSHPMFPKKGDRMVAVKVAIEGVGKEGAYSAFHFQLEQGAGLWHPTDSFGLKDDKLVGGNVKLGEKVTGWIGFFIPEGATGLKLLYRPFAGSPPVFAFDLAK